MITRWPRYVTLPRPRSRSPAAVLGRYTLAILTGEGWAKLVATAPGHVEEVRRLIFDPLTKTQTRQLHDIGHRIMRAIDPDAPCLHDRSPRSTAISTNLPT
jgi:hypothetical protein